MKIDHFQVIQFVVNAGWSRRTKMFCAILTSHNLWDAVVHSGQDYMLGRKTLIRETNIIFGSKCRLSICASMCMLYGQYVINVIINPYLCCKLFFTEIWARILRHPKTIRPFIFYIRITVFLASALLLRTIGFQMHILLTTTLYAFNIPPACTCCCLFGRLLSTHARANVSG